MFWNSFLLRYTPYLYPFVVVWGNEGIQTHGLYVPETEVNLLAAVKNTMKAVNVKLLCTWFTLYIQ